MRHTFISKLVAKFRSIGEAALQAGNSETIIRKHYLDLKDAEGVVVAVAQRPSREMPSRSITSIHVAGGNVQADLNPALESQNAGWSA